MDKSVKGLYGMYDALRHTIAANTTKGGTIKRGNYGC